VTLKLSLVSVDGRALTVLPCCIVISSGLALASGAPFTVALLKLTVPNFASPSVPFGPWFDEGASAMTSADDNVARRLLAVIV
jgi:hypothetical protein